MDWIQLCPALPAAGFANFRGVGRASLFDTIKSDAGQHSPFFRVCVIHWFESIIAKENFLIFVKEVVNKRLDLTLGNSKSYGIFSRQICRNDFEELENLGKFSYLASPCQNRNFFLTKACLG